MPTKVCLLKAMVYPVVVYGCESWMIKRAERWRIDAFELWCWRILLRVPWTARRSNQSILKEISPEYSLEGVAEAEAPVLWPPNVKNRLIGKRPWSWERLKAGREGDDRGWDGYMSSLTGWMWIWASSGSWWGTGKPGVLQSMGLQRVRHYWATELRVGLLHENSFPMNHFRIESNNNPSLQMSTPTKLACPVKEKSRFRGEKMFWCAHLSDLPSRIKPISS